MCSAMPAIHDNTISDYNRPREEEKLIINATAWQLPPDGEVSCEDTAAPGVLSSRKAFGTDECHCNMVLLDSNVARCAARPRAATWPCGAVQATLLRADAERDTTSQHYSRPFLSLMLPEWVHEKAAEDEAAVAFRCRSLIPLSTPTSSTASSPASSCASSPTSSPTVPSKAGSHTASVRRSGVNWADLEESDEDDDGPITYAWSTISTATSSPAATSKGGDRKNQMQQDSPTTTTVERQLASPQQSLQASSRPQTCQNSGQPCAYSSAGHSASTRWVDLVDDSDIDPGHSATRWADLVDSDVLRPWSYDASSPVDASDTLQTCHAGINGEEVGSAAVCIVIELEGPPQDDLLAFAGRIAHSADRCTHTGPFPSAPFESDALKTFEKASEEALAGISGTYSSTGFQGDIPTMLVTRHCRRQVLGERRFSWPGEGGRFDAELGKVVLA